MTTLACNVQRSEPGVCTSFQVGTIVQQLLDTSGTASRNGNMKGSASIKRARVHLWWRTSIRGYFKCLPQTLQASRFDCSPNADIRSSLLRPPLRPGNSFATGGCKLLGVEWHATLKTLLKRSFAKLSNLTSI
jgi:hypothetical protein